jgi:AcrR family transcriptional regulator
MFSRIRYSHSGASCMKPRKKPAILARKRPRQARSNRLVADILQAAVRVLARDGAHRFTTARVAEAAGVSVGSLYQYFPNKQAILFRLQSDEWEQTGKMIDDILGDTRLAPLDRLRAAVRAFFRSEFDEAELRVALGDAVPHYRDAPETAEHRKEGLRRGLAFMKEALPGVPARVRSFAADLVMNSMSALGKQISEQGRTRAEVDALAVAAGEMYCAYLVLLIRGGIGARAGL